MRKLNGVAFVLAYVLFMIPTYILPFFGSNSYLFNGASLAAGLGMNPFFWMHLLTLLLLVGIAWWRGRTIGHQALVVFPGLALVFDLAPVLNAIPLVPTAMHLLTLVLGLVWVDKEALTSVNVRQA